MAIVGSVRARRLWLVVALSVLAVAAVGAVVAYRVLRSPSRRVWTLPASVATDCSRPVDIEVNGFLARVPENSTIEFRARGCYALDGSIEVNDRRRLKFDGRGSTFKSVVDRPVCRPNWRVQGGSDIVLTDMIVRGLNTTGFDGPRDTRAQCQAGYEFDSVQGAQLLRSASYDTIGDPVAIQPDGRKLDFCLVPPNRGILVDHFRGINSGRTVSITHADGVVIRNSYFGEIYDAAIDVETDDDCESARNIRIIDNHFGRYHYALISYTGAEKTERGGGFEFSGNVQEAVPVTCFPAVYLKPPTGIRRNNFIVRNNQLKVLGDGIALYQAVHARIEGNVISKNYTGCQSSAHVVAVHDSDDVNVYGNQGIGDNVSGFAGELETDGPSTDVTQSPPQSTPPFPALPDPADIPPTVRIATPEEGATLSGVVPIKIEASGGNLRKGQFSIDKAPAKTDFGPNYDFSWDTATAGPGPHTIDFTIANSFGLESSVSVHVTVG